MEGYLETGRASLYGGECLEVLAGFPDDGIDAIVTDPPAGIAFMGKEWDRAPDGRDGWIERMSAVAAECLRVLKPGGHAVVWALPRTSHWTAMAWENAGFEVRDRIIYCFGSGFPKSLDVSKAIDKAAGAEREIVGTKIGLPGYSLANDKGRGTWNAANYGLNSEKECTVTAPATPAACKWEGWGTALKPAVEDWWLLRKPLSEGTIAANVLKWRTGAINVDGCRIAHTNANDLAVSQAKNPGRRDAITSNVYGGNRPQQSVNAAGRWPANLIHDGSEEVVAMFPQTVTNPGKYRKQGTPGCFGGTRKSGTIVSNGNSGSAARFFYAAKASRSERGEGNNHPTVKAVALMRYLCRLITPPGGVVLDPFMGSGSTGVAALKEGFRFIGIEREAEYCEIAKARILAVREEETLFSNGKEQVAP